MLILKALFWAVFASLVACIEIEIEGKHGWAEKIPTWYRVTGRPARLYGKLNGGRPLTGYHLFMFMFPAMLFHAHFFMGVKWTLDRELIAWAMYFSWCVFWDFHWFVLNPAYKKRFNRENVWWYSKSKWILSLFPTDYLLGLSTSALLSCLAALCVARLKVFTDHMLLLTIWLAYTLVLIAFSPVYHRWYGKMRGKDERHLASIFHKGE